MILAIGAVAVLVLVGLFFMATYKVIGSNEAHVLVIMGSGRKIYSPVAADGVKAKTAYFYIPGLMKRYIMPLTNVKLDIQDIQLNDLEMAPFECDVVTWLHIKDPVKAAERLDFTTNVFTGLHQDLIAIVQAIARAASMKQEILDIMRDRSTFSKGVSAEVDVVLKEWGVELVNLEVNDIRDTDGSNVIHNYEEVRKATVASGARIQVSQRNREAIEKEQENSQLAGVATANADRAIQEAGIARDEAVGVATQAKESSIAVAAADTNQKKVDAYSVTTVGTAKVQKEAAVTTAEGEGEAIRIKGEKEAAVVALTGKAAAEAIEAKGLAEAKAKDAMAEALKKFNDAGISLEQIRANVEIQKAFAVAYEAIAANAEIKVVTGGEGANILGLPMNAKTGADLGQMVEAFGGVDAIRGMLGKGATTTKE